MNKTLKTLGSSLLLFGMAVAPAIAADHDRDRDHGRDRPAQRDDRAGRDNRYAAPDRSGRDAYQAPRGHDRRQAYTPGPRSHGREVAYRPVRVAQHPVVYAPPRHVHQSAPWRRGGYYHGAGYGPTYVVDDWHGYGLRRPPHGYYWRRSDAGEFLLVALATGIITDIILNR